MAHVITNSRAQDQPNQILSLAVHGSIRRFRIEQPASWKANDVIQKAQRSAQRVVLVVDLSIHVVTIRRGNHGGGRLVVRFRPSPDLNIRKRRRSLRHGVAELENHEKPRMPLESLVKKRPGYAPRLIGQQLRFHAVNSRGLLQRLDHVSQQLNFDLARVRKAASVHYKKITDHSLAAFVNEKAVAEDAPAFYGRISRQDFRVDIAQDHLRRSVVVPGKQTRPDPRLI